MSFLTNNIVFIWLIPLIIQILFPLAMLVVWLPGKWIAKLFVDESKAAVESSRASMNTS